MFDNKSLDYEYIYIHVCIALYKSSLLNNGLIILQACIGNKQQVVDRFSECTHMTGSYTLYYHFCAYQILP